MAMTLVEKILAFHSGSETVKPGDIKDIEIDIRVARDFGGANVVKNIKDHSLRLDDPGKTLFTFDCNPTGSDQKYAVNQHICRQFARDSGIRIYDINAGIGTHLLVDEGYVWPGATAVSTDSHANILGAVGAFGQGMGDMDIAASWHNGKIWFKVPPSAKINLNGKLPDNITAKDVVLNLLNLFGANDLLGYSVELKGDSVKNMTLDQRMTISSMATEMGAIIILFAPSSEIIEYCRRKSGKSFKPVYADPDATYDKVFDIDATKFLPMVARPGKPHDTVPVSEVMGQKIDSAFIGSCTNGRMEDMQITASLLKDRKVAPGVVLKIVPATDEIWNNCLHQGFIDIFKQSGALVSNAGCAGCAAGQVGQNGPGEVTISTGNRNFPGKQGKGNVYLASPSIVAASAVAGHITNPENIPSVPSVFENKVILYEEVKQDTVYKTEKPSEIEGRVWFIGKDNVDTDMIFHNRYLSITDIKEMGQFTFDNLEGFEDFAKKARPGDIVIAGKNFGSGSSRQQAVDCFVSLGIQAIIAESFGAIYERNAINAAFPVITCKSLGKTVFKTGDIIRVNFTTGEINNKDNNISIAGEPFSDVQLDIYKKGGLLT